MKLLNRPCKSQSGWNGWKEQKAGGGLPSPLPLRLLRPWCENGFFFKIFKVIIWTFFWEKYSYEKYGCSHLNFSCLKFPCWVWAHPSLFRGAKSKVDELRRFFQGSLEVPLGPQKEQKTNTFTENFFPFSRAEIRTRYL